MCRSGAYRLSVVVGIVRCPGSPIKRRLVSRFYTVCPVPKAGQRKRLVLINDPYGFCLYKVDRHDLFALLKYLDHRNHINFDVHLRVRQVGQRYAGCSRSGRHKVGKARM